MSLLIITKDGMQTNNNEPIPTKRVITKRVYYLSASEEIIERSSEPNERLSNCSLLRLASQVFEEKLLKLEETAINTFPIFEQKKGTKKGFIVSEENSHTRNELQYKCKTYKKYFTFPYTDNILKTYVFAEECLKRFKDNGSFIIEYDSDSDDIIETNKRAWLLSWNPVNWNWDGYEGLCKSTKTRITTPMEWACTNRHPKVGDEVFLIKLGTDPKGIIAHGGVTKESFMAPHYDPKKASNGETISKIMVQFDRIQNFSKEPILPQKDLEYKLSTQEWSPQGSGIEIKKEVLSELREMWAKLIEDNKNTNKGDKEMDQNKNTDNKGFDKNMILYGPPGTGKTYNTAIYAVAICDNKPLDEIQGWKYEAVMERYDDLKKEGRVAFTTFHQSYGYEEFIEGIRPVLDEEKDIGYTIEDGIFKKFCKTAGKKTFVKKQDLPDMNKSKVWSVLLDGTGVSDLKTKCFKEGTIRIGWMDYPKAITFETEDLNDKVRRILLNFQDEMNIGDIVVTERSNSSIDGIGIITGDYEYDAEDESWPRKRKVKWLKTEEEINITDLNDGYNLDRKTVYQLWRISAEDILSLIDASGEFEEETTPKPYVFVIDEINRGNISKIFGELITLIEDTKRLGKTEQAFAILPYSGEAFGVPANVHIIGTMNTADRSIALMDTAIRRRFEFIEMMPDTDVLKRIGADKVEDLDVAAMLDKMNERITLLYDREHTIGHAFFTRLAGNNDIETLGSIFEKSIIPLLQEYFYEDYGKIQLVLGDNGKVDSGTKFIVEEKTIFQDVFKGRTNDFIDLPERRYRINHDAFSNIESYKLII